MVKIIFITGSEGKFREVKHIAEKYGIKVERESKIKKIEIQSDSIEEIVKYAISMICREHRCQDYLVIEDDGLFINALKGFPGPYSAYTYKTIGLEGILKLLKGVEDRSAYFMSVMGLCEPNGEIKIFTGIVSGYISHEVRGTEGFGYDPIFIPENYEKTFAEMSIEEKCRVSHRARALMQIINYVTSKN